MGFFQGRTNGKKKEYVSQRTHGKFGGCWVVVFGAVFALAGTGLLFALLINPWIASSKAKDWQEVPCEVIWSRVRIHDGEDGDTYAPDIFYEYKFNGEVQRSNRYAFTFGSSSGLGRKRDIVRKYPTGAKSHCFVDPAKPWRAVLNRDRDQIGFWWLIPLVFLGVGVAVMIAGVRTKPKSDSFFGKKKNPKQKKQSRDSLFRSSDSADRFSAGSGDTDSTEANTPKTFRSRGTRIHGFIGTILLAAFWNGIAGVIFVGNWLRFLQGADNVDGFLLVFSIPFLLVGILLMWGVLYAFAGLFNPHTTLRIDPGIPRTGQELLVDWDVAGGLTRIRRLRIMLEGVESASYTRGTDRVTDEETFYRRLLVDESSWETIRSGSVIFEVPLGVMPTLDLIDNNIAWRVTVEGTIPRWPSVLDTYEIEILPFETDET